MVGQAARVAFVPLKAAACVAKAIVAPVAIPLAWYLRPKSSWTAMHNVERKSKKMLRTRVQSGHYIKYSCRCKKDGFCEKQDDLWFGGEVVYVEFCFGKVLKNHKFAEQMTVRQVTPRRCKDKDGTPRKEVGECGKGIDEKVKWEPLYLDDQMNEYQSRADGLPVALDGRPMNKTMFFPTPS